MHDSKLLNAATTVAIGVNVAAFAWGLADGAHREIAETVEDATLAFFCAEMALRVAMQRGGFFRTGWNVADLVITVVAALPMVLGVQALGILRAVRLARYAHLLRHTAHFRVVSRYEIWRLKRRFTPVEAW